MLDPLDDELPLPPEVLLLLPLLLEHDQPAGPVIVIVPSAFNASHVPPVDGGLNTREKGLVV